MAEFKATGLDGLILSFREIAELPEEVQDEILNAQADVVVEAQKKSVKTYGIYDGSSPVHVAAAIKKGEIKLRNGQRVIYVSPTGTRTRGKVKTRNAEILFVNEFGKRGQKARPAIADANEHCAEETVQAGMRVYDRWLTSKNL